MEDEASMYSIAVREQVSVTRQRRYRTRSVTTVSATRVLQCNCEMLTTVTLINNSVPDVGFGDCLQRVLCKFNS